MLTNVFKKQPVADFKICHYTTGGRSSESVINDIKSGVILGAKEGGKWYVCVNCAGAAVPGPNADVDFYVPNTITLTYSGFVEAIHDALERLVDGGVIDDYYVDSVRDLYYY